MTTQETEYEPGVTSSMRVTVRVARFVGTIMNLFALALTAYMAIKNGRYELIPVVVVFVSTGSGLILGVSAAKAWQSQAEAREGGGPPASAGR